MLQFLGRMWRTSVVGWRLLKEVFQIVYGVMRISRLSNPCVSIFGGSRLPEDNAYVHMASDLAKKLVKNGLAVLTGGGPGIMEAANCGAAEAGGEKQVMTLGISIFGMHEEELANRCVSKKGSHVVLDYFFARKWLLINYSIAFFVFPGGLGTMDELSDLLNQMVTTKIPKAPVVLIGKDFWRLYREWLAEARARGLVSIDREPDVLITDDIDEAVAYVLKFCASCPLTRRI